MKYLMKGDLPHGLNKKHVKVSILAILTYGAQTKSQNLGFANGL